MATRIDRMKGLREKTGSAIYANLIPFGTDGKLVDMLSGLDLEEELMVGGNHYVSIQETSDTETAIVETYAKKADVEAGTATDYHVVTTTITTDSVTDDVIISIVLSHFDNTASTPEVLRRKTITIGESGVATDIEEVLNT